MLTKRKIARWENAVRQRAHNDARALAVAIVAGTAWMPPPYDLGIVLEPNEVVWCRCPATYRWRGAETWTVQHASHWGHRFIAQQVVAARMFTLGTTEWVVTNLRLATRAAGGQVIAVPWSAIGGLTVDLAAELVVLDGQDGYHGELSGPAIAPIAVAGVATCHGRNGLLEHPGLEILRMPTAL